MRQNRSHSNERPTQRVSSNLRISQDKASSLRSFLLQVLALWAVALGTPAAFAQSGRISMTVGTPTVDANGVQYYPASSVYQGSVGQIIRVLAPTNPAPGKPPRL